MSVYTAREIMEIIPHRHPFMLIDTIEELEEGVRAVGKKCVSFNEPYFAGDFRGNPVMPGVLGLPEWKGRTAYFAGINKARFKQKVLPGDVLMLETKITKVKGPIGVGEAVATVDGRVACRAELMFAIGT